MTDEGKENALKSDDAVEALLGQAAPRPVPPAAETEAVREAVRAEWRQISSRQRSRKRWTHLAIAASVLIAVFVSLNMLRTNGLEPVQVASVDTQFGSVHLLGDGAELLEATPLTSVRTGETLITDNDSGMGLSWGEGGSLRIDANTTIEFVSREQVYLQSGRVYFDSEPALVGSVTGSDAKLTIMTDFGEVTHVGTQYMTHAGDGVLTVSVRSGEVVVQSAGESASAGRNQQLAIAGSGVRSIVNIRSHGAAWEWVENTSPAASLDGRSVSEFLGWVSHETGMAIEYESAGAEGRAEQERLNGTVESGPRQALQVWMLGTDLEWRIENGVIYVKEAR